MEVIRPSYGMEAFFVFILCRSSYILETCPLHVDYKTGRASSPCLAVLWKRGWQKQVWAEVDSLWSQGAEATQEQLDRHIPSLPVAFTL